MGIAEQDLMGTAAGLALGGKIPFASTFAMFATGRAWEQIRQTIAYGNLNVKIVASHGGVTVGEDGGSHQAVEDLALMRILPNLVVLVPADGPETRAMTRWAAGYQGPVYMRTGRMSLPLIYDDSYRFELGRGSVLREGATSPSWPSASWSTPVWRPPTCWPRRTSPPGWSTSPA